MFVVTESFVSIIGMEVFSSRGRSMSIVRLMDCSNDIHPVDLLSRMKLIGNVVIDESAVTVTFKINVIPG